MGAFGKVSCGGVGFVVNMDIVAARERPGELKSPYHGPNDSDAVPRAEWLVNWACFVEKTAAIGCVLEGITGFRFFGWMVFSGILRRFGDGGSFGRPCVKETFSLGRLFHTLALAFRNFLDSWKRQAGQYLEAPCCLVEKSVGENGLSPHRGNS